MSGAKTKLLIFCLLVFLVTATFSKQKETTPFPHLSGKYFGQKEPGGKAELFAPGLISLEGRYEFALSFSPAGDELLFSVQVPGRPACLYYAKMENGEWTEPKPVSLSNKAKKEEMEAFFSWDGRYIFFAPYDEGLDVRIWKVVIHEDGWHHPQPLKGQISDESAFFPTTSKKGTLYYSNITQRKIYRALLENGVVRESSEAGLEFGGHGFIAPDESFILVDSIQADGHGKQDIYVAFRNEDGGWSKPVNLGDKVNTEFNETCPSLSSDGKYLFFSRYNEPGELSNIYWIDSRIIYDARKSFHIRKEKPEDDFPVLKGPYLGQKPPGLTPEIFAPDILNTKKMGAFCSVFSPDGDEFYFVHYEKEVESSGGISWMRMIDGEWTKPEMLHFNSAETENDMCMSLDGNRLFFRSWRALPGANKPDDRSFLWFVHRTEEGWSQAKLLHCGGGPVRTGYPSIAANGNLYFAQRYVEDFGIYRAKPVNGAYSAPEHVFTAVDSIVTEGDMFVAPDESYMIISCWDHPGNIGSGQGDLYITFRKDDGTWTDEINMGELINTRYGENCPQVSPDGKYFFFNRYNPDAKEGNIYWVDAKIIEELKPMTYQENKNKFGTADLCCVPGSCTIFSASFGNTVLYGNNEDYRIPTTYFWAEPSGENTYGGVFVGFDNFFPQGGVNEEGLAFDFNALPEAPLNPHTELPDRGDIIKKIYQTCATVEEAIALVKRHNWGSSIRWQVLLADATGDAVVISAGPDGELAFTRKPKGDGYLVSTNFNRANPKNTYRGGYPCWRYNKAVEMLEKIEGEKDLTVDYFKSILDACHVEGPVGNTLYSNVFDLKNGIIYLYHWHQFHETAVLKVDDEITKKRPPTRITELFTKETVKRAEDEYQGYKKKK